MLGKNKSKSIDELRAEIVADEQKAAIMKEFSLKELKETYKFFSDKLKIFVNLHLSKEERVIMNFCKKLDYTDRLIKCEITNCEALVNFGVYSPEIKFTMYKPNMSTTGLFYCTGSGNTGGCTKDEALEFIIALEDIIKVKTDEED